MVLVKQLVLEMDEIKYVDLVEKVSEEINTPKFKKNEILKKIYEGKLNYLIKNNQNGNIYGQKFTELIKECINILKTLKKENLEKKTENEKLLKINFNYKNEINTIKTTNVKLKEQKILEINNNKIIFEDKNNKLKSEILFLNEEKNILKKQVDDLFQKMLKKDNINNDLQNKLNLLKKEINKHKEDLKNLKNKIFFIFKNSDEILSHHFSNLKNKRKNNTEILERKKLQNKKNKLQKLEEICKLKKSNKLLYILTKNNKLLDYLEIKEIRNIKELNKSFNFVTKINPNWIKKVYNLKIKNKEKEFLNLKTKLNYFKKEGSKITNSSKKYFVYKNFYKRELNYSIKKYQKNLGDICERILEETLGNKIEKEIKIEKEKPNDNFSFFNKIKSTLAKLNENGITDSLSNLKNNNNSKELSSEELEKNFKKYYNLFFRLNIFNKNIDYKNFIEEGFNLEQIDKYINSISQLLKKKKINYNLLVDILSKILKSCFLVYSDYKVK